MTAHAVSKTYAPWFASCDSAAIFPPLSYSKKVSIFVYENFLTKLIPTGRTDLLWKLLKPVLTVSIKQNYTCTYTHTYKHTIHTHIYTWIDVDVFTYTLVCTWIDIAMSTHLCIKT